MSSAGADAMNGAPPFRGKVRKERIGGHPPLPFSTGRSVRQRSSTENDARTRKGADGDDPRIIPTEKRSQDVVPGHTVEGSNDKYGRVRPDYPHSNCGTASGDHEPTGEKGIDSTNEQRHKQPFTN